MTKYTKPTVIISIPWELYIKGGVNTVVKGLISEFVLLDSPYNVILHINNWQKKTNDDDNKEYKVIRIPTIDISCCNSYIKKIKYILIQKPRMYFQWYRVIKKHNVQVINVHFPTANVLSLLNICKLFKIRLVFSFHGADIDQLHIMTTEKVLKSFSRLVYRIVVCSLSMKERLIKKSNLYSEKIVVIPNGIDSEKIKNYSFPINENKSLMNPYFVNIATFEPKKGQDLLIHAFQLLNENYPDHNHQLILIGRKTNYLIELQSLVNQLGLSDKIVFYTNLNHKYVMQILSKAELFLLPSRDEPFGLVLLEAGWLNIPIMAHAVGGVKEILSSVNDGILITENTAQVWYQELIKFLTNKYDTNSLVENFSTTIDNRYSSKTVSSSYIKLFQEV
ncbi:glycosyltransferase family 4 protein [Colwellia sp. 6_MG-2023]|uniref:glycosyltransferase family 4 protein n=1 Tax=Colwellia sp. 6_MG-2023 TaxID=3062676 RepID=UPI0026E1A64A|nr:glycosyltransferase family 4 protein [Colwellia sp. 6_MG-2023]MDO6487710.1 glycosyltransferase family 4 protein [Colwellia sp. 6_MG-2023]